MELPENDANYSLRWRCIKTQFANNLKKCGLQVLKNKKENTLWQRKFWEHAIRDDKDYEAHVNYVHYNPVKHKLVRKVEEWPFSTFHRYVKNELYPKDWCYQNDDMELG